MTDSSKKLHDLAQAVDSTEVPMAEVAGGVIRATNAAFANCYGECSGKTYADFFAPDQVEQLEWLLGSMHNEADKIVLTLREDLGSDFAGKQVMVQLWPLSEHFCLLSMQLDFSMRRLADIDELTRLPNRRKAMMLLDIETARAQRESNFCLTLADIDHFKSINDTYGHDIGDLVLREVSKAMSAALRGGDWVARWGGEEFLILTSNSDIIEGIRPIERIREQLKKTAYEGAPDLKVTMSFGMVSSAADRNVRGLIYRADILLYDAKQNGRNRIEVSGKEKSVWWFAENIRSAVHEERIKAGMLPISGWQGEPLLAQALPYLAGEEDYGETEKMLAAAARLHEQVLVDHTLLMGCRARGSEAAPYFFPLRKSLLAEHEGAVMDCLQHIAPMYAGIDALSPPPETALATIAALGKPVVLFNYDGAHAPAHLLGIENLSHVVFSGTHAAPGMMALLNKNGIKCYAPSSRPLSAEEAVDLQQLGFTGYVAPLAMENISR